MACVTVDCAPERPALIAHARSEPRAGRGGRLLPPGFLSTAGSQIVDERGRPVRIASIGWNGTEGPPGSALAGLWSVSYRTVLDSIRAAGFNTVRIPWNDAGLEAPLDGYRDELGTINTTLNPDLVADPTPDARGHYRYVTTLGLFGKVVTYAGEIGLKVIFDHHGNEGTAAQGRNGLWFDLGPGIDGTPAASPAGRVTAGMFRENWLRLARTFAGNPTVIGFDLHNEPNGEKGRITWGGGGPADIKAMCETVGAALQGIHPGPLIICEGPEFYSPPPAGSGMAADQAAPAGNLTGAGSNPVRLPVPHKLVYSVHEYPDEIADTARFGLAETGPSFVDRMNRTWGYLVRDGIAPVWIGEMGTSFRTPAQRNWARTLIGYMQGNDGQAGGPTFKGSEQPVSGSWWLIGPSNDPPFGLQTAWGLGHLRPEQVTATDRMLMR